MVLRLAFNARLAYVRNEGFRTTDLTLPFKILAAYKSRDKEMVALTGETSNLFQTLAEWNTVLVSTAHPVFAARPPADL